MLESGVKIPFPHVPAMLCSARSAGPSRNARHREAQARRELEQWRTGVMGLVVEILRGSLWNRFLQNFLSFRENVPISR